MAGWRKEEDDVEKSFKIKTRRLEKGTAIRVVIVPAGRGMGTHHRLGVMVEPYNDLIYTAATSSRIISKINN